MNHNYTRLVGLLDKSPSMQPYIESTITSFNNFLNTLKADHHGTCRFKLVQFNETYWQAFDLALPQCPALTTLNYTPGGHSTSLLDAQGRAIDELGKELRMIQESDRPGKVIFITLTDGQENSSKHYTHGQVSEMIEHQQKVYNWDFIYLGANQDAIKVGGSLNIPQYRSMSINVADPDALQHAYNSVANYVNLARGMTQSGVSTSNLGFSEQDRKEAIGGNQSGATSATNPLEPAINSR